MTGTGIKGLIGLAATLAIAGAAPALAVPIDFEARADAYLKSAWPTDGPGAAVVVMDDGKIVYARGRGLADIETRRPITPQTVFRLGSITKQFSAAVIMQLAEEGKLSLDDRLSKFIPDYPQPGASATVRQLLNHTVGVQSYTGIPGWMVEENTARPHTTEALIAHFRHLPSPSKPGEAWSYNNSGYVLVGAIIEAVTGQSWHQAVEERISRRLRLDTIRYGAHEADMPQMARGYTGGKDGWDPAQRIHMSVPHAAGALIGNAEDLARWAQALHQGRVVSPESYAMMIAPTQLPDGSSRPYGFGLGREEVRGREGIGHGGGIFGFATDSIYIPGEDLFVAVLTNSDDPVTSPSVALQKITAMALGDPFPQLEKANVNPASIEPLFGVYAIRDGAERHFFTRDGKLYTRRSGGSDSEVFAAGNDRFFYGPNSLTWFRIVRDSKGAHVMEMHQQGAGEPERAVRRGAVPAEAPAVRVPREVLDRYIGAYSLGPVTLGIARDEDSGGLTAQLTGQRALPLVPVSATEFRTVGRDARLTFQLDAGKVTGLTLHQGGREMKAVRVDSGS